MLDPVIITQKIKQLESKIEQLEQLVETQQTIINELFKYSPDGDCAQDAQQHFNSLLNT